MRRPGPRKRRRKIRKLNRVRIQGIEADDRAVGVNHHVEADIIRLGELVRSLLEIVVDLLDTARKSRPIMPRRIERLDGIGDRLRSGHLLRHNRLAVPTEGCAQGLGRRRRRIKRRKERLMIDRLKHRPVMRCDRC